MFNHLIIGKRLKLSLQATFDLSLFNSSSSSGGGRQELRGKQLAWKIEETLFFSSRTCIQVVDLSLVRLLFARRPPLPFRMSLGCNLGRARTSFNVMEGSLVPRGTQEGGIVSAREISLRHVCWAERKVLLD